MMARSYRSAWALALASLPLAWTSPIEPRADGPFDMPLTWTPFGFVTDALTLGTPPQKIPCFVDWTWIGQYVFSTICHGGADDTFACLNPKQGIFNQTKSKTFVNETKTYAPRNWNPNHFFFYDDLSVQYGSDIETVGTKNSAKIVVQLADMHFTLKDAYPFSGVFGLSPGFSTDNATTESAFYQLWKAGAFRSPLTSFIYCYNGTHAPPRSVCNGHDGVQTLGGYRSGNVKTKVEWYDNILYPPVNEIDFVYDPPIYNYWALPVTKMKIGDEVQPLNLTYKNTAGAIFDHASYGRGAALSTNGYKKLIALTKAKPIKLSQTERPNNGNQSDYSVDCSKISTFPALKYTFAKNPKEWSILPENYVEKVNSTCVLNIRTLGEGDFQIGNFGETFARDKQVIFDFDKLRVGIADVAW